MNLSDELLELGEEMGGPFGHELVRKIPVIRKLEKVAEIGKRVEQLVLFTGEDDLYEEFRLALTDLDDGDEVQSKG